jgi:hypothetical protein
LKSRDEEINRLRQASETDQQVQNLNSEVQKCKSQLREAESRYNALLTEKNNPETLASDLEVLNLDFFCLFLLPSNKEPE